MLPFQQPPLRPEFGLQALVTQSMALSGGVAESPVLADDDGDSVPRSGREERRLSPPPSGTAQTVPYASS